MRNMTHWGDTPARVPPGSSLVFNAPLMWELWPTTAVGGATPTFSCANAGGTVQDWEGVLRKCKPNEARFPGARRVENMVLGSSQNLTVAPWTTYNTGANSAVPVRTWAYAGTQATRLQLNMGTDAAAGVASVYQNLNIPVSVTGAYRITIQMQSLGNPTNMVIALGNQINNIQVTTTWVLWTFLIVSSWSAALGIPPSLAIGLYGGNSGGVNNSYSADLLIARVQVENVSGQSNTNPGEYQSVGMGGTAYANVDGVRYYGVKNANTISGNTVTGENVGTIALTTTNGASAAVCDVLGPTGILMDQQQTVAYGIEWDFTVAGAANMTYQNKVIAGPTGDYYACGIVETTGTAQRYINPYGTLPFATTNTFFGFFVKPYQRNTIQMNSSMGNDTVVARYTLAGAGTVTYAAMAGTGGGTLRASGIIPYAGGWYYCWVLQSATAAQTAMNIGLFAENGGSYGGSGSTAWYLYGLTVMDTGADPYTPCQYATATRGTDTLSFPGANLNSYIGTAYAEVRLKWASCYQQRCYLTSETYKLPLFMQGGYGSDSIGIYDGVNLAVKTGLPSATNVTRKVASSWSNGSAQQLCTGSGQFPAVTPFAGTMNATTLSVGYSPWVGLALGGQIRNLKVWDTPSFPGDLQLLTA